MSIQLEACLHVLLRFARLGASSTRKERILIDVLDAFVEDGRGSRESVESQLRELIARYDIALKPMTARALDLAALAYPRQQLAADNDPCGFAQQAERLGWATQDITAHRQLLVLADSCDTLDSELRTDSRKLLGLDGALPFAR